MDDKQKSPENNSSARQGIFSTPNLTVDTEKLAQASSAENANKTRVASFFANTDATRQAQQPVIASQPVEGDVIIDNAPKKRSKLPIIILVAVVIIAIIVTVVLIISKNTTPGTDGNISAQEAFNSYYELLTKGPKDYEGEKPDEWFLFSLPYQINLDLSQKNQYIADLLESFGVFSRAAVGISDLGSYSSLLQQLSYGIYPSALDSMITNEYLKDGNPRTAYQLVNNLAPELSEDRTNYFSITSGLRRYALAELNLVELYATNGCIKDGIFEYTCTQNLLDSDRGTVNDLLQQQENALAAIKRVIVLDKSQFTYRTQTLKETVGGDDHE